MCKKLDLEELKDISIQVTGNSIVSISKTYIVVIKTKSNEYHVAESWSFSLQEFYVEEVIVFNFDDVIEFRLMSKF